MTGAVPDVRIRAANAAPVRPGGAHVLYWMIAARRATWSFGLQRAVEEARRLGKPLVVLEALRVAYPHASDRLHRFVLEGMAANERAFEGRGVTYYPYVEPTPGAGSGLLEALAASASLVVTDEFPTFFLPRMVAAAARKLTVRLEVVDSNGIYPVGATERVFTTARSFRIHLQKELRAHLRRFPVADPLAGEPLVRLRSLPAETRARWPRASAKALEAGPAFLASLPIDHSVGPAPARGGREAGLAALDTFLSKRLAAYPEERNEPDAEGTSGLSPYLHFGHVGAHEVVARLLAQEGWHEDKLSPKSPGKREGWWGVSPAAEAFLDQIVTWRELGFNLCSKRPDDYARFESLPGWAQATLAKHEGDPRSYLYSLEQLARAETHDPLWNAAQRQLSRQGWCHNYMRMLWGKKILEWSESPRAALEHMIALMDRLSLDGRDPNSYTGYLWTLGRYDRPWAPERPIFGTIRYMSSANTARKLHTKAYVARFGP